MVKLSSKYLIRKNKSNKYFLFRRKNDTDEQFLKRITHLPLQNHFVEQILKMNYCENVKVLYLQNNLLKNLDNMDNFPNLTHLYLQRNFLEKLENLNPLTKLRKIYLGYNGIQVLEGMENLKEMEEIHLECQDLPLGATLLFEPLTVQNLGETLRLLNISENNITSLQCLKELVSLKTLIANYNHLEDINDIVLTIREWRFFKNLSLIGNAVTKNRWYKDSIIIASKTLEFLDNLPVNKITRLFIEKLTEQKRMLTYKQKTEEGVKKEKVLKFVDCVNDKETCFDFDGCFPTPKTVYLYPAWGLRANVLPKCYRKKRNETKLLADESKLPASKTSRY